MAEETKTTVKASAILAYAEQNSASIQFKITDDEDLYPVLANVSVNADEKTHKCTLSGSYGYRENTVRTSVCFGYCNFTILGVNFSTDFQCKEEFSTSGNDIDFEGMTQRDFWEKLSEHLDFPEYDPDSYPFDEESVDDGDLIEHMDYDYDKFAIDADGDVCAFEEDEDIPTDGSMREITTEEAEELLAEKRPGLTFDLW